MHKGYNETNVKDTAAILDCQCPSFLHSTCQKKGKSTFSYAAKANTGVSISQQKEKKLPKSLIPLHPKLRKNPTDTKT